MGGKKAFNRLSPAEAELLALLAEECAEVIHMVGKALRHGLDSHDPLNPGALQNRELIAIEIGHVQATVALCVRDGIISRRDVQLGERQKLRKVGRWLHHAVGFDAEDPKP